ncbi:MAG: T9SS C-terminal target domain-containing protein [Crocinitomicaceae bacterium]|nr:T9SS C-terminal target domain-containing protein [Crocinitomicaceae bacterium]
MSFSLSLLGTFLVRSGVATLKVTDIAGKVAIANTVSLVNGKAEVNIASLEAGMYIFNVVLENGKTSQFNLVKK